jgi:hypothetical protein
MNQLSRSTGLKIAAVILWTVALLGIVTVGIPFLTGGRPDIDGPIFWVFVFSFAVDAITLVVAYGVWRAERWAIIMAIVISAFNAVLNTMGALADPDMALRLMAGSFVVASLSVIYLCLRREPAALAESA